MAGKKNKQAEEKSNVKIELSAHHKDTSIPHAIEKPALKESSLDLSPLESETAESEYHHSSPASPIHTDFSAKIKEKVKTFFSDKYNVAFIGILILAFIIRLKYVTQESLWNDSAVHLWYAIKVTREPLFFFSPSYLMGDYAVPQTIMALFYLFTKNILLSGQIVATLYALVGIIVIYLLGTELKNKFFGLMAASVLAFNHIFWFYSVRPLGDSPLLVTTILLLYCMVRLEKENTMKWAILSGAMFLAVMFTKLQSSLFVFALLIYYLVCKRKEMFKNKAILWSWLIPVGSILIAHLVGKFFFGAKVLDRIFILFLDLRGMPFGLEALGMIKWIFSTYLLVLAALGLILVLIYKEKKYYFPITLFFFYWLFFEVNVDNTQDRYMLPLLSVGVLLAVFALEEIRNYASLFLNKKITYLIPIAVVLLLSLNYYQIGNTLIYNKTFTYTGYEEAGTWIKENVPDDALVFAGEYRSIRLFSEREFGGPPNDEDLGGNIWNLRSPYRYTEIYANVSQKNFEEDIRNLSQKSDIYLEIDHWEYAQPSWYWPLKQESFDYFIGMGFQLVKVVEREVPTDKGFQKLPVIFILKKDKEI